MLTKEEKAFLYDMLDQITVRGIEAKAKVLVLMGKLSEEDADIPVPDADTSE